MRNQADNYPVNFPLQQICLHIWQKLLQTMDTGKESLKQQNGCCQGILTEVTIIAAGHLTAIQVSEPVLSNYSEVFPHKDCICIFFIYTVPATQNPHHNQDLSIKSGQIVSCEVETFSIST